MHTFAARQKYVGRRAETRRFCFCFQRKTKEQQIIDLLLSFSIKETKLNFVSNLGHPQNGHPFFTGFVRIFEITPYPLSLHC